MKTTDDQRRAAQCRHRVTTEAKNDYVGVDGWDR